MGQDGDEDGKMQVTFRMDRETVERLDDLIWENKVEGNLGRDANRSDVLRDCVRELVEELEGNSTETTKATPVTAD